MHDGDPVHRSRVVKKLLKDNHVPVLEFLRKSMDLNPIENAWNYIKSKVQETHFTNIQTLKEVLIKLWVPIYAEYFRKFVESMPNILHNVIKAKGHMTKLVFAINHFNPMRPGYFRQLTIRGGGALKAPPPLRSRKLLSQSLPHHTCARCFRHVPIGIFQKFAILTIL